MVIIGPLELNRAPDQKPMSHLEQMNPRSRADGALLETMEPFRARRGPLSRAKGAPLEYLHQAFLDLGPFGDHWAPWRELGPRLKPMSLLKRPEAPDEE